MEAGLINLMDRTIPELESLCLDLGEKKYRARQIFRWLYKGIETVDEMTNLPEVFREKLKSQGHIGRLFIEKKYISQIDGTIKYLLRLEDGNIIESVLMKYSFGISACLSTQIGCRMGCSFCASTIGGMVRDLSPGEMIGEILAMQEDSGERISGLVLMGSGEPLDNFENVIKFLRIVNAEEGLNIGMRHITLSTCGLVPEIRKLAELNLQITLAISLHAPNDIIRRSIMPIAGKYSLEDIIEACRYYTGITNRRITFEYSLIDGMNDSETNAKELVRLLRGLLCHVNLIPVNTVKEREYRRSSSGKINTFKNILDLGGIEVTVRRELGADINAACGQLRKNYLADN